MSLENETIPGEVQAEAEKFNKMVDEGKLTTSEISEIGENTTLEEIDAGLEKEKSENTEILDLEIGGQKFSIEVRRKEVRYPERIQNETGGVLGHERVTISWDNIDHIIADLYGLGSLGISSQQELDDLLDLNRLITSKFHDFFSAVPRRLRAKGTLEDLFEHYQSSNMAYLSYAKREGFVPNKPPKSGYYLSEEEFNKRMQEDAVFRQRYDVDKHLERLNGLKTRVQNSSKFSLHDQIGNFVGLRLPNEKQQDHIKYKVLRSIYDKLSGGRFINDTFNHFSREDRPDLFKRQGIFLQKVFSPEFLAEGVGRLFNYLRVENNQLVEEAGRLEYFELGKAKAKSQERKERSIQILNEIKGVRQKLLRNGTCLLTLMSHGLDVSGGNLWGFGEFGFGWREDTFYRILRNDNVYAFSTSNRAFGRYMEKILKIFDDVEKKGKGIYTEFVPKIIIQNIVDFP